MFNSSLKFDEGKTTEYFIDNKGNVYVRYKVSKKIIQMKPQLHTRGYLKIRANSTNYFIHRLVAIYFLDKPVGEFVVNHIDGNKINNSASNLEWVTPQENTNHSWSNGLSSGNFKRKLTNTQVNDIRANKDYLTLKALAKKYNVSVSTIKDVRRKKHYKDV